MLVDLQCFVVENATYSIFLYRTVFNDFGQCLCDSNCHDIMQHLRAINLDLTNLR